MTYLPLDVCWAGGCENPPTDESGLCDDCFEVLLQTIDDLDVSFP